MRRRLQGFYHHRRIQAGEHGHFAFEHELARGIARSGAENVGDHQHAVAGIDAADQCLGVGDDFFVLLLLGNAEDFNIGRRLAREKMLRQAAVGIAEGFVGDDEYADHKWVS